MAPFLFSLYILCFLNKFIFFFYLLKNHPSQGTRDASNCCCPRYHYQQGHGSLYCNGLQGFKENKSECFLEQSREKFIHSLLEEAQVIGVRETALKEPIPDTRCPGEKTLRMEIGLRLRNVQDILMGAASQSSTSDKLFEGWNHLAQFV